MAIFELRSYHAQSNRGSGISVKFYLDGTLDPIPKRRFETNKIDVALAELEAFKAELEKTGLPSAASIRVAAGRAPNGWKGREAQMPSYHRVNV